MLRPLSRSLVDLGIVEVRRVVGSDELVATVVVVAQPVRIGDLAKASKHGEVVVPIVRLRHPARPVREVKRDLDPDLRQFGLDRDGGVLMEAVLRSREQPHGEAVRYPALASSAFAFSGSCLK